DAGLQSCESERADRPKGAGSLDAAIGGLHRSPGQHPRREGVTVDAFDANLRKLTAACIGGDRDYLRSALGALLLVGSAGGALDESANRGIERRTRAGDLLNPGHHCGEPLDRTGHRTEPAEIDVDI